MLRKNLPPLPVRLAKLAVAENGYPIPYFVGKKDGKIDFRVVDQDKILQCIRFSKCWICGEPLGKFKSFVGGPISTLTALSYEPPCHVECATFAVKACPHIINTMHSLRPVEESPAIAVNKNVMTHHPDVYAVYTTDSYTVDPNQGHLSFNIGHPLSIEWWYKGGLATREQVDAAIEKAVVKMCEGMSSSQSTQVQRSISMAVARLNRFLPANEQPQGDRNG